MPIPPGAPPAPPVLPASPAPRATYRVQLHGGFGFDDAAGIADYLRDLGVSHLYSSPVLQAAPASPHGYDVVDPGRLDAERGGQAGFNRLGEALGGAGLGLLVDVVPNHMAISGPQNAWWWDVLTHGQRSRYAGYFDVDWDPPEVKLRNRVLLPILGDHYGRELDAGRIRVEASGGDRPVLRYFDHVFPLSPASTGPGGIPLSELDERALDALNADPDALDDLLEQQSYRLAWWRTADEELDYRRFFDINGLAALRVEDPQVFDDTHRLVVSWLSSGTAAGVRVDHVDGLSDPGGYLARLAGAAPGAWVVVEKILEGDEELPAWPVAGTTGYEWLCLVGDLLVDPEGWEALTEAYRAFSGVEARWEDIAGAAKRAVLDGPLAADLRRLVGALAQVCEGQRRLRDYTRRDLRECVAAIVEAFDVYRTYLRPGSPPAGHDVETVEAAVRQAGIARPDLDPELLGTVRDLLLGQADGDAQAAFVTRFQQLTGPVMAKAVEDTAFYRYLPLVSRNEVGGNPGHLDADADRFHRRAAHAQAVHPQGLLATSTHDTKRSEDVRARLAVLSELPEEWASAVRRWNHLHQQRRSVPPPDRNTEWLAYQTIVGAWPIGADRLCAYLTKAVREAKEHTSWTDADPLYEAAVEAWATEALSDELFTDEVERLVGRLRRAGWVNALSQKLLTLTAPGVADLYQGSETWDLSLVDPDNRRPVDFEARRRQLARAAAAEPAGAWRDEDGGGLSKTVVVLRALRVRAEHPECFAPGRPGAYRPVDVEGPEAGRVVSFTRGARVATVVARFPSRALPDAVVSLPPGTWEDRLGGGRWRGDVAVTELLDAFPVGLLVREQ